MGQERPKEIIHQALNHQQVPHAYLFHGPEGVGKLALAIEFAKAIFCAAEPCDQCSACRRIQSFSHPDFIFVFPMPKSASTEDERAVLAAAAEQPYLMPQSWAAPTIGIDRIRELRRTSALKPLEGRRVVIIHEAEKMTTEASNALLKILEEPPESMYMVLITSQINALLPTIYSRCQEIKFGLLNDEQIQQALVERQNLSTEDAYILARVAQGSYRRALEWLDEDLQRQRESVVEFLRNCLKDDLTKIEQVNDLLGRYDKRGVRDLLGLLLIWFRDALILTNSAGSENNLPNRLVNADKADVLYKFINAFDKIDFDAIFHDIEHSIFLIDRNVQLNFILMVLLLRLQRYLKLKSRGDV